MRPLRAWVLANAVGETLGLGLGALIGLPGQVWLAARMPALPAAVVAAIGFALIEGSIVGYAQWRVLARLAPRVSTGAWLAATIAGGLTAWLCVSIPFALIPDSAGSGQPAGEPPLVVQLLVMAVAGLAAGPILGLWQAVVLRARLSIRPWAWVWANSRARAVGLPIVQLVAGGLPAGTPSWTVVVVAVGTLAIAGCVVGRIHGPTLLRLVGSGDAVRGEGQAPPPGRRPVTRGRGIPAA